MITRNFQHDAWHIIEYGSHRTARSDIVIHVFSSGGRIVDRLCNISQYCNSIIKLTLKENYFFLIPSMEKREVIFFLTLIY